MIPTDPLEAAWEDMLSELRFGDDTEVAYVEEVVAKHRPLIEAATPRPAGVGCWFCKGTFPIEALIAGYDTFDEQRLACLACNERMSGNWRPDPDSEERT